MTDHIATTPKQKQDALLAATYRHALWLTQAELAKLLGKSPVLINAWESQGRCVPPKHLATLAAWHDQLLAHSQQAIATCLKIILKGAPSEPKFVQRDIVWVYYVAVDDKIVIALLVYTKAEHMAQWAPEDAAAWPHPKMHRASVARVADALRATGHVVLVPFEPEAYAAWLGDAPNTTDSRAAWAFLQARLALKDQWPVTQTGR